MADAVQGGRAPACVEMLGAVDSFVDCVADYVSGSAFRDHAQCSFA